MDVESPGGGDQWEQVGCCDHGGTQRVVGEVVVECRVVVNCQTKGARGYDSIGDAIVLECVL